MATAAALTLPRPDAVLAMSPPIFLGNAASLVARRWRVPFVFNVQDIFPDVAVELGALTNRRVIAGAARLEASLYRRADAVTVLSQDQAANVRQKMPPPRRDRVRVIANFVDLDRVHPVERDNEWRRTHGLTGKTVVMYAGNVGMSQSFDLVEQAAIRFRDRPDVHFVINGEGAARPDVDAWASAHDNVSTFDFVEREGVSDLLGAADLHLILLKAGLSRSSTPSKLYGIMAAGRPILASIDLGSEVDAIVTDARCGVTVAPEDPAPFLAALEAMLDDPASLVEMGDRAEHYVQRLLTPATQAEAYEQLFAELIDRSAHGDH
jgi:colanic acid biosynthesis glycosyl transferase WcaI